MRKRPTTFTGTICLLLFCHADFTQGLFRGLEPTGITPQLDAMFHAETPELNGHHYADSVFDNLPLSQSVQLMSELRSLSPSRFKRALEHKDLHFARGLKDNLLRIFRAKPGDAQHRALTSPCLGDLVNFVDAFSQLLLNSAALERCTKGQSAVSPTVENCKCLQSASGNVTEHAWVLKFLDSMGKLPSGVLHGNYWFLGDFQQCVGVEERLASGRRYRGKFCMTYFSARKDRSRAQGCPRDLGWDPKFCGPLSLNVGICMPETCSNDDVVKIVDGLIREVKSYRGQSSRAPQNESLTCMCLKANCHKRDVPLDAKAIVMLIVLAIIVALMFIGTVYDYWIYQPQLTAKATGPAPPSSVANGGPQPEAPQVAADQPQAPQDPQVPDQVAVDPEAPSLPVRAPKLSPREEQQFFRVQPLAIRIVLAFSVLTNGRKLFDTTKRPDQIHCVHGLRFLSLAWVIFGHTYYWILPTLDNLIGVRPLTKHVSNQIILNATFCVDCFFLLSAMLLAYLWLKNTKKTKGAQIGTAYYWIMFYIHRYIRLTPVYALVLGVDICLYRYITDGPFWNQDGLGPNSCRRSWWTNLLYLNNFLVQDELCMSWTWYITDGPFWNQDGLEPNYCRRSWWTNLLYLNNFLVQDELCMSWTWYITDGPFWNQDGLEPNYCRRSWWTNLLYLNNFLVQDELCMSWTWYITDGPFWNQDGLEPNYCRRSWWTNLLYLNNFLVQDELCMSWTWYITDGPFWNQDGLEPNYCRRSWWTNLLYLNNFLVQDELCMSWTWYITDGPFWNQDGLEPNYCRRSWWTNLLYLNNFLVQDELCMSWTWYLANDFQFYLFAPVLLLLLWKWEIVGVVVGILGILGTGVIKGVLTIQHNLPPSSIASMLPDAVTTQARYWDIIYVKPYTRGGVYILGLLFGWLLFKTRGKRVRLPWPVVALGWAAMTGMHLALLFGLYRYSAEGQLPPKAANFIYAALARPLWGAGLCWIMFCCVNGYGGWVDSILSWGFWIPLSRLTYCAYLVHAFVAHGTYSSRFQSFHFDTHLRMVYYFFGHVIISYMLAMFFHLAFEAPILILESILFGRPGAGSSEKKPTDPAPTPQPDANPGTSNANR